MLGSVRPGNRVHPYLPPGRFKEPEGELGSPSLQAELTTTHALCLPAFPNFSQILMSNLRP